MASRIIAYIVLTATQVFGRAFAQAYREAAAKAGRGGGAARAANAAKQQATAATAAGPLVSRKSGMSLEEALKVLNITKETPKEEMISTYDHLFKANDKEKGGSFYIQSKVYRAHQTLEELLPEQFGQPIQSEGDKTAQDDSSKKTDSKQ
eukprot:m.47895 g.47895  ORF g.47895 m.47895 type:complete len:150 (-) comp12356_c2_seq1:183-632(-)